MGSERCVDYCPHGYRGNPARCVDCLRERTLALPGCETADAERAEAAALAQAEELTAELLRPLGDISDKAGRIERDSPLFFGTGDNPSLF